MCMQNHDSSQSHAVIKYGIPSLIGEEGSIELTFISCSSTVMKSPTRTPIVSRVLACISIPVDRKPSLSPHEISIFDVVLNFLLLYILQLFLLTILT